MATDTASEVERERHVGAVALHRERTFLRRARLLQALDDARSTPVVCVLAPGGYGKTTLLRQWARADQRPVVWVSPAAYAADASTIAQRILDAMAAARLVEEPVQLPSESGPLAWHLTVLPLVQQAVARAPAFLLVVDEAEALSGDDWESLLATVVTSLPAGAQLAIGTRGPIPESLAPIRGEGAVQVLGVDQLAFDPAEGLELLGLLGAPISSSQAHAVMDRTQGWPVAVYLSGVAARRGGDPSLGPLSSAAGLTDYLRTQILDRLDMSDADFLLRVSVLDSLDVRSCDAVAGSVDSLDVLRRLSSSNQLVLADELHRDCYQLHPLLSAFLRDELRRRDPDAWAEAHARASRVRQAEGDLDSAVHHARMSGDTARLGSLIWSQAARLFTHGQISVLMRWTAGIDEASISAGGHLALTCAYVAALRGDLERAHHCRLAAARLSRQGAAIGPEVDLLTAMMAPDSVAHMHQQAASFLDARDDTDPWSTLAEFLRGVALMVGDQPHEASEAIWRAYHLSLAHDLPAMRARSLAVLAHLASSSGRHGHRGPRGRGVGSGVRPRGSIRRRPSRGGPRTSAHVPHARRARVERRARAPGAGRHLPGASRDRAGGEPAGRGGGGVQPSRRVTPGDAADGADP